jgi:hypothetical protein
MNEIVGDDLWLWDGRDVAGRLGPGVRSLL